MNINKFFNILLFSIHLFSVGSASDISYEDLKDKILTGQAETLPHNNLIFTRNLEAAKKSIKISRAKHEDQIKLTGLFINEQIKKFNQIAEKNQPKNKRIFSEALRKMKDVSEEIQALSPKKFTFEGLQEKLDWAYLYMSFATHALTYETLSYGCYTENTQHSGFFNEEDPKAHEYWNYVNTLSNETFDFDKLEKSFSNLALFFSTSQSADITENSSWFRRYKSREIKMLCLNTVLDNPHLGIISYNLSHLNSVLLTAIPVNYDGIVHDRPYQNRFDFLVHETFHNYHTKLVYGSLRGDFTENGEPINREMFPSCHSKVVEIYSNMLLKAYKYSQKKRNMEVYLKTHLFIFMMIHELTTLISQNWDTKWLKDETAYVEMCCQRVEDPDLYKLIKRNWALAYLLKGVGYKLPKTINLKNPPLNYENNNWVKVLHNGFLDVALSIRKLYGIENKS